MERERDWYWTRQELSLAAIASLWANWSLLIVYHVSVRVPFLQSCAGAKTWKTGVRYARFATTYWI